MGVYRYLLQSKKRKVAVTRYNHSKTPSLFEGNETHFEGRGHRPLTRQDLQDHKPTLMLMTYTYKERGCPTDRLGKWIDRKEELADNAAEKERDNNRNKLNEDTSKDTWMPVASHLVVHGDDWNEVQIGDEVFLWDGRSGWSDCNRGMEVYGYIIGKRKNGQFVVGSYYCNKRETRNSRTLVTLENGEREWKDETYYCKYSIKSDKNEKDGSIRMISHWENIPVERKLEMTY